MKEKTGFIWVKTSQKVFEKQSLKVGDLIKAEGRLSGGQYQDKNGNWQNNLCVFAFSVVFYSEQEEVEEALPTPDAPDSDEIGF
ncbi:hypothetical protein C7H19_15130 [Aphanothece hegewaldii CCALA 016]|uniref:Single-stranded DNA-binding protein n=1 Tax=Aphanothece hegewaldii CCALA 016 TaxID=2107694 RepID=A0A2T1LVL0_9CHRO|nr:hypothetical protein [Aphanothece hegewaldii]PSF35757.1 hypothetical protein C7H19_15130 [Aphanothece hegewaldii CCALA 016]